MGSDDRVDRGGLAGVIAAATTFGDAAGFTIGVKAYDSRLEAEIKIADSVRLKNQSLIEGSEEAYLIFSEQFGFISAQVINREIWLEVCRNNDLTSYYNAYVHLFIIGKMLQICPRWGYVPHGYVGWRSGNDSFMQDGWLKRMNLDVVGYSNATIGVFGKESRLFYKVRNRIAASHIYRHLIFAKSHDASSESLKKAACIIRANYGDTQAYRLKLLPVILIPTPAIRVARQIYRKIRYRAN